MTNHKLFISSCIMFIGHVIGILYIGINNIPIILQSIYIIGCYTSLLNHGMSDDVMQLIDRLTMVIGFIINMYFIIYYLKSEHRIIALLLLLMSVTAFFMSKYECFYNKNNEYAINLHIVSHMIIVIANVYIMIM